MSSHPNSRFCTPITNCTILAAEYYDPQGVPISAILFGGRRRSVVPLVTEARDWAHGVFLGATTSSETTAAATGAVGVVRRDPMAMLPFIGYHAGDYFKHWLDIGKAADSDKLPKIFFVNWFRKSEDGRFLWPGFGENSRVLEWIVGRVEGIADAAETPVGRVPAAGALDLDGLDISAEDVAEVTGVDVEAWKRRGRADRGMVRQDRAEDAVHPARRAGRAEDPARGSVTLLGVDRLTWPPHSYRTYSGRGVSAITSPARISREAPSASSSKKSLKPGWKPSTWRW